MALRDTMHHLHELFSILNQDLEKASKGNKSAAQRVRTGTIQLEKIGKKYRKESMKEEKKQLAKTLTKKSKKSSSRRKIR